MPRLDVAFVWHFHQPSYMDFFSRKILMPWVRLHGIKDYTGLALLLREFPSLKMTFNFTPSLLEQLWRYEEGGTDVYQDLLSLTPDQMMAQEEFILRHGFHAHPHRMIGRYGRYAELKAMRDGRRYFTAPDFVDLVAWSNLVWFHPLVLRDRRSLYGLIQKGSKFTPDDLAAIRQAQVDVLKALRPMWSDLIRKGQVEVVSSPFYHPILPLLANVQDSRHYGASEPLDWGRALNDDARAQMKLGLEAAVSMWGRKPVGVWPSEMSVSNAAFDVFRENEVQWVVADEDILGWTSGAFLGRNEAGVPASGPELYRPHRLNGVHVFFRDKALSNLIGFTYQNWAPEAAANDLLSKLERMADRLPEGSVVTIALDGENPWEHYADNGVPFLSTLFWQLSRHEKLRCTTPAEVLSRSPEVIELQGIHPGSWINANFGVWSGDEEDRRAWRVLKRVRDDLESWKGRLPADRWTAAQRSLFAAEGSDWFWWYGPDFSTSLALEYDALFRRHLMGVYKLAGRPCPEFLHRPIKARVDEPAYPRPTGPLRVTLDGDITDYFEWLPAGRYRVVHDLDYTFSRRSPFSDVYFGSDHERFFLRLDPLPGGPAAQEVSLVLWGDPARPIPLSETRRGRIVEASIPLSEMGVRPGDSISFQIQVATDQETLRLPMAFPLRFRLHEVDAQASWSA